MNFHGDTRMVSLEGNVPVDQFHDHKNIRAIIEIASPTVNSNQPKPSLYAYGVFIWGCGKTLGKWGTVYTTWDGPVRAIAVGEVLDVCAQFDPKPKITVITKSLLQPLKNVSGSTGLKTDGKTPFSGFDVLKPIQEALEQGLWHYEKLVDRTQKGPQKFAKDLAIKAFENTPNIECRYLYAEGEGADYQRISSDTDPNLDGLSVLFDKMP